jgi:hypothetical protein
MFDIDSTPLLSYSKYTFRTRRTQSIIALVRHTQFVTLSWLEKFPLQTVSALRFLSGEPGAHFESQSVYFDLIG